MKNNIHKIIKTFFMPSDILLILVALIFSIKNYSKNVNSKNKSSQPGC